MKRAIIYFGIILCFALLFACQGGQPPKVEVRTVTVNGDLTGTPSLLLSSNTPTHSPVPTNSPTHTSTPVPTNTSIPTLTPTTLPTSSPTADLLAGIIGGEKVNVMSGPANNYRLIASLPEGFKISIVGRNHENDWLVVQFPGGETGWCGIENLLLDFESLSLPIFEPPPVPLPTETPLPIPYLTVRVEKSIFRQDLRSITIHLFSFIPNESFQLEIFDETGKKMDNHNGFTNINGNGQYVTNLPVNKKYTVIVVSNSGSRAEITFIARLN